MNESLKYIHKAIVMPPIMTLVAILIFVRYTQINKDKRANGEFPMTFGYFLWEYQHYMKEDIDTTFKGDGWHHVFMIIGILFWGLIIKIIFL